MKIDLLATPADAAPCPVCGETPKFECYHEDQFDRSGKRIDGARRYGLSHMGERHYVGLYKGHSQEEVLRAWNRAFGKDQQA